VKRKPLIFFLLVTVIGSFLTTEAVVLAQQPSHTPSSSSQTGTVQTITQQIASLEVERILLDTTFTPDSPVVQNVERNLQSLRRRLAQLQPNGNQAAVSRAIREAIRAKIAELQAERSRLATRYISDHPSIQKIDSQLRGLNKRLQRL
jgi:uncharacterized protein involved in exopolysaccharide biosynthesis